jgi:membrane carboxypeptidase/penicillin-binding protein PbpC
VKTGTTTDFRDNWTIGYTPELVVGVWVGNANNQPMLDATGLSGAAPIWHQFMRTVSVGQPDIEFEHPSGLVQVEVCALSGLLPTEACAFTDEEWFIQGTEPARPDGLYRLVVIDTDTMCYASEATAPGRRARRVVINLPPEALPWARSQGLTLAEEYACKPGLEGFATGVERLRVIAPDDRSVFQRSPEQPAESQRIRIEAVNGEPLREVTLWLDGELLAAFEESPYIAWWTLALGEHQVWAQGVTEDGERVVSETVYFEVRAEAE